VAGCARRHGEMLRVAVRGRPKDSSATSSLISDEIGAYGPSSCESFGTIPLCDVGVSWADNKELMHGKQRSDLGPEGGPDRAGRNSELSEDHAQQCFGDVKLH